MFKPAVNYLKVIDCEKGAALRNKSNRKPVKPYPYSYHSTKINLKR